jgi:ATP-binding cassette, subfamily B, bacterial
MNYNLNKTPQQKSSTGKALRKLFPYLKADRKYLIAAVFAILITSSFTLASPYLIGSAIDKFVATKHYDGLLRYVPVLLVIYGVAFCSSYTQTRLMGFVGQNLLFRLRNAVFGRLLDLPIAFFNQNRTGDLISRINNDTDKLNQFFAQSLVQFIGGIATMTGAAIYLVSLNWKLGLFTLIPAAVLFLFTRIISPWVKSVNATNLKSTGGMSAEIQESLNNFKVIIAFNRRDYFRKRFAVANEENYNTAVKAGLANNLFMPVFTMCANFAQLAVLSFGIYMISQGEFTVGLLISYLSYATYFYNPIRQLAALWTTFQVAMASWDRIAGILEMESDQLQIEAPAAEAGAPRIAFRNVNFRYPGGKDILHDISFEMEAGKTYALVGPTGGGKTTTASLIARLYDASEGAVLLNGRDIRAYSPEERTRQIGFILQEPFLFSGTIQDNIVFGNARYASYTADELLTAMKEHGLEKLLERFDEGLATKVSSTGDSVSLGQKQLIAFMRAVLRDPDLLVLDEATANIDTVTEQLLEEILRKLPAKTTRVIIAHRLNTIENADEIFFVNAGEITRAGSFDHAMNMLLQHERHS